MNKVTTKEPNTQDRIAKLSDELIHHILSFTCTKLSVQTSLLSKRWQHIWKSLTHLNFNKNNFESSTQFSKFLTRFFSSRTHQYPVTTLHLYWDDNISPSVLKKIILYAVDHNVENLEISGFLPARCPNILLPVFSSGTLRTLRLNVFWKSLLCYDDDVVVALPGLRELCLCGFDVPEQLLALPGVESLCLGCCDMLWSFSGLRGLSSLCLKGVRIYEDRRLYFSELVCLRKLVIEECDVFVDVVNVSGLELRSLSVKGLRMRCKFVVLAPKLAVFECSGRLMEFVFLVVSSCLCKVNLEMDWWFRYKWEQHEVAVKLTGLLQQLQTAKVLTIDWNVIEALSKIPDLLTRHSPLKSLKFLKVKQDLSISSQNKYTCSTIPAHVRTYLQSGLPSATTVKEDIAGLNFVII